MVLDAGERAEPCGTIWDVLPCVGELVVAAAAVGVVLSSSVTVGMLCPGNFEEAVEVAVELATGGDSDRKSVV